MSDVTGLVGVYQMAYQREKHIITYMIPAIAIVVACQRGVSAGKEQFDVSNNVCGPRCVQHVLSHYGVKDADLASIIKETQWPEFEEGSSITSLRQYIRSQSLYCEAIEVPSNCIIEWEWPVIIHIKGERRDDTDTSIGHYLVSYGYPKGSYTLIWDGSSGYRWIDTWELYDRMSGAVILTRDRPFDASGIQATRTMYSAFSGWLPETWTAVAVLVSANLAVCFRLLKKRKQPMHIDTACGPGTEGSHEPRMEHNN